MSSKGVSTTIVFLEPPDEISDDSISALNETLRQIQNTFKPANAGSPITKQVNLGAIQIFARPRQMKLFGV